MSGLAQYFDLSLAKILSSKIKSIHPDFNSRAYHSKIKKEFPGKGYTDLIILHAESLGQYLPQNYEEAISIIINVLGPENPNETGMFKEFFWILPFGKFVELYGLDHFDLSINAIAEITKRNTGEYAIRPYLRKYPKKTLRIMKRWAKSDNFHLRRLASEGLRPKLPWSTKLDVFVDKPEPVFEILEILKEDEIKFVQKSVGNHLTDYLKVNPDPTIRLLKNWNKSKNPNTKWIVKRATRKHDIF